MAIGAACSSKAYAPWAEAARCKDRDPRIRALRYAILAPNVFNVQPWIAELIGSDSLLLRADPQTHLSENDADDRQLVVSFGTFLELLRMAASEEGYDLRVDAFQNGEAYPALDGRPIAEVAFVQADIPRDPLFRYILQRRSNKLPFENKPVPSDVLNALQGAALAPERIGVTNDPDWTLRIKTLARRAYEIETAISRVNLELLKITRIGDAEIEEGPDGITLTGSANDADIASGVITRATLADLASEAHRKLVHRYLFAVESAAAYVWITTPSNSRTKQLEAGRDWVRLNLKATELGVDFQPNSQSLHNYPEMLPTFREMHRLLGAKEGQRVQMLSRLGYGRIAPPTPRWPAEKHIVRP